jgi:hypothetical protein
MMIMMRTLVQLLFVCSLVRESNECMLVKGRIACDRETELYENNVAGSLARKDKKKVKR